MKPKNMEVVLKNHIPLSSNENGLIIHSKTKAKGNNVGNNNNNNNALLKTSISVPSSTKKTQNVNSEIIKSSNSTFSETTKTTSSAEESLCDDILSCISALDEVIAEFDDSVSQSSQSSSSSSQLVETTKSENPTADTKTQSKTIGAVMDSSLSLSSTQNITQIQITGTSSSQPNTPTKTIIKPSPIKPPRQTTTKSAINNSHRHEPSPSSTAYVIESGLPNNQKNSANFNTNNSPTTYTSYGIIFPKKSSPSPQNQDVKESQLSPSKCLTVTTPGSGSSIPVTFVVKNDAEVERLKQNLEGDDEMERVTNDEEEVESSSGWNCYIERNLPRSLRNTRKTCFIEDEDDPNLKYPRSPKDYRKNCDKEKAKKKHSPGTATTTTEWIRTEHLIPALENGNEKEIIQPLQPPIIALRPEGPNGANGSSPSSDLIDDGYLSMINRPHDSPPWPEGFIESETFTPEELKRLSIPPQQDLDFAGGSQEKTDYFSDDSLEFEPPEQSRRQYGPIPQQILPPQQQSFFIPFEPIPPIINLKSSRKSWSPGSEVRIPTASGPAKNFINTNTWRKGPPPSLIEEVEERNEKTPAVVLPNVKTRKPCAFFIPVNDGQKKLGEKNESEAKTETFAGELVGQLLEFGMQEAASINALLESTAEVENPTDEIEKISLSSSSLDIVENEIISNRKTSKQRANSSSSGIDYASSTPSSGDEEENFLDSLQPQIESSKSKVLYEYIEDLHENPPPFIPPPPKEELFTASTPIMHNIKEKSFSPINENSFPLNITSSPVFPVDYIRKDNYGERVLRTQRQASRSHENLLDLNPRIPHPSVRRGHSATLPPNSLPPTTSKMSNPFRQLLGIFRKNKNKSTNQNNHQPHEPTNLTSSASSSIMDLPIYPSPTAFPTANINSEKYGAHLDYSYPPPNQFYYNHHRPSISESHGSQRSSISKTSSSKRSVLSRIFRRKEK